jgi:hypothetical protein
VTGGTATGATTFGDYAVDHIVYGALHQANAIAEIDFMAAAAGFYKCNFGHRVGLRGLDLKQQ